MLYERQQQIIKFMKEKHFATVKELAATVYSSESSVRRDIKALESAGYVKQIYGGAVLTEYENSVVPLNLRDTSNSKVKEELAKKAARYLFDGATVIMDGSSTVRRIIKYIDSYSEIKIITNNQKIFDEFNSDNVKLYCTGGMYSPQGNVFYGSGAENYINGINADVLFFSSQAISEDGEISDASEEETSLRKAMLSRAKTKIFLCDCSKIGLRRTFRVCSKDDVDVIISDAALPWEK